MDAIYRKKISVIAEYALNAFNEGDWFTLGQITGKLKFITEHPRLLRSLHFCDDDYAFHVADVINNIFSENEDLVSVVIDHFDIDLWYQQKHPERYLRIFSAAHIKKADFWDDGFIKLFVSHLSSSRGQLSALKSDLFKWGISAFLAHEDIEPSREWRDEVEAALDSMDILLAVVQPGFKDSEWCPQEVGIALGRKIDVIPLRAGLDPFGFFGKYQGIQIKGKRPSQVSQDIVRLLLKKPRYRENLLQGIRKAMTTLQSDQKIFQFECLDSWSILDNEQLRILMEQSALSQDEKQALKKIIARVSAFEKPNPSTSASMQYEEIPF